MPPMPFLSDRVAAAKVAVSRGGHPAPLADIIRAQSEGAAAVHAGVTLGRCPYVGDRSERGKFLALMSMRGYSAEQERLRTLHGHTPL